MTIDQLIILLAVGVLHSASLWLVTLMAKRLGLPSRALRYVPLVVGVPSAWLGFSLALQLVMGAEHHTDIGALLGIPAAAGAEACYRLVARYVPQLAERLLGQSGGGTYDPNNRE